MAVVEPFDPLEDRPPPPAPIKVELDIVPVDEAVLPAEPDLLAAIAAWREADNVATQARAKADMLKAALLDLFRRAGLTGISV